MHKHLTHRHPFHFSSFNPQSYLLLGKKKEQQKILDTRHPSDIAQYKQVQTIS